MRLSFAAAICCTALAFGAPVAQAAGSDVCPAGTDAGTCLNNSYRAIDELRARVNALEDRMNAMSSAPEITAPRDQTEEGRASHPAARPAVSSKPDKNGCKGGQVFINEDCLCPLSKPFWDGDACTG